MINERKKSEGICVVCEKKTHGGVGAHYVCWDCYKNKSYKTYLDNLLKVVEK